MKQWIDDYINAQKAALDSIPPGAVADLIEMLRRALLEDRQVFVFGNGGSAANSSHFAIDLGKGASDKLNRRFRILSLNENVAWMTALAKANSPSRASYALRYFASCIHLLCIADIRAIIAPPSWDQFSAGQGQIYLASRCFLRFLHEDPYDDHPAASGRHVQRPRNPAPATQPHFP